MFPLYVRQIIAHLHFYVTLKYAQNFQTPILSPQSTWLHHVGCDDFAGIARCSGTSTLNIAEIDQRIAYRNRQHAVVVHASHAGTEHARDLMRESVLPSSEGFNQRGCRYSEVHYDAVGEVDFGGVAYHTASGVHNLGVYYVFAVYQRCGIHPRGTPLSRVEMVFVDYWEMESVARMRDASLTETNASKATVHTMVRKVMRGGCKVR